MRIRKPAFTLGRAGVVTLLFCSCAPVWAEGSGGLMLAGPLPDGTPLAALVEHFQAPMPGKGQAIPPSAPAPAASGAAMAPQDAPGAGESDKLALVMPVTAHFAPSLATEPAPGITIDPELAAPVGIKTRDRGKVKAEATPALVAKPRLAKNDLALDKDSRKKKKDKHAARATELAKPAPSSPDDPPANAVESLRDAIVASLKGNPEIQIALAQQDDARYAIGEARAAYLPHLDVSFGYGREFARAGHSAATYENHLEASATLNQHVWDFGITINDIKRARANYRSAQWAVREKIENISYDITNAYLGVLQQQKLVALAQDEIETAKHILHLVEVQKDLGLTTAADVSRAQSRLENVQSTLLDRKSALQQARIAYRRLTSHLPARAVDLPPSDSTLPAGADEAVDMIDTHSPHMAQAVEDRRSLAKQLDSQTGTFFPRIGLQVQGNHKYDVMGKTGLANDARAMVTVNYNIFNGGADRALRNRIGARIREADYELDRRRREVEQDIRTDFDALKAARDKIATINAEIGSAQKVVDLYKEQFREGKRTVFDLLDSETQLYAARANFITNASAMHAAEYRVLQKLGGLFDLVSDGEHLPAMTMPTPGG